MQKRLEVADYFWLSARLFVGIILAYAGFMKLMEPRGNFEFALQNYPLIPDSVIPLLSGVIPWMEWILGIFLIVGYAPRIAALFSSLLFLVFVVLIGLNLVGGKVIDNCGCFGERGIKLSPILAFFLDAGAFALSVLLLLKGYFPFSIQAWFKGK